MTYRAAAGHTLVELLVAICVLAVTMQLLLPTGAAINPPVVDAAVKEVAMALRFAQSDAIRTGSYRVVGFDTTNQTVRVYGLDLTQSPPTEDTAKAVNHPLDKTAYKVALNSLPGSTGAALFSAVFALTDSKGNTVSLPQITFAADGTPVNVVGPNPGDANPMTSSGTVVVTYGGFQRAVTVDPGTGRVTVSS